MCRRGMVCRRGTVRVHSIAYFFSRHADLAGTLGSGLHDKGRPVGWAPRAEILRLITDDWREARARSCRCPGYN